MRPNRRRVYESRIVELKATIAELEQERDQLLSDLKAAKAHKKRTPAKEAV